MVNSGDEITYTYNGGNEVAEDISGIDEILIRRMDGAGGGNAANDFGGAIGGPKDGGQVRYATVGVSGDDTLSVWVGGQASLDVGGFGRFRGGDGVKNGGVSESGGGGGSTELVSDSGFIAAADAGGGAGNIESKTGGGGGARGGTGGTGTGGTGSDGEDGEGSGFGGRGSDYDGSPSADPGGQELGLASLTGRGSTTTGGGNSGDGEIVLAFDVPLKPLSLTASEDFSVTGPAVDLSWSNEQDRLNRIYRTRDSSGTFPDDFAEVGTAAAGEESFTDNPPDFETTYTYRVTAESGGESDPSDPVTITTSSAGELVVTVTSTNSPVTTGETLELNVDVENVGDYRADEDIDAVLEPQ